VGETIDLPTVKTLQQLLILLVVYLYQEIGILYFRMAHFDKNHK